MVTLSIGAVGLAKFPHHTSLKVEDIEVGRAMPNMELTIVGKCHEQITSIGRHPRKRGTLAHSSCIKNESSFSELLRAAVKCPAIDIVLERLIGRVELGIYVIGLADIVCRGIVEHVAGRAPRRECLKLVLAVVDVIHL